MTAALARGARWAPLSAIARHAASVLIGQLAVIGFGIADAVLAGRHGAVDLAALSIGASIYVSVYIGLTGVVQALIPVVGHHHGARDDEGIRRSFQQGSWLALFLAVPGALLLGWPQPLLSFSQAEPAVVERARDYLGWLAWALIPGLLFRVYSSLNQGLSRPWFVTGIQIVGLGLKIVLNLWLINGGLGVAPMGVEGCGLATLIVMCLLALTGFAMLARHRSYAHLHLFADWQAPRRDRLGELLRLGLPAGAATFFEVTGFAMMAIFIARLGTAALAAHQIAMNIASVCYMLPLSIAIATGAQAAQAMGAGNDELARRSCRQGLALAIAIAATLSLAMAVLRVPLTEIYSTDAQVLAIAAPLMLLVGATHVFDAIQCVASFALRAWRVAVLPAVAYCIAMWGLGIGGGAWLAFTPPTWWPKALSGPLAFWSANSLALVVVSSVLLLMLQRVSAPAASAGAGRSR